MASGRSRPTTLDFSAGYKVIPKPKDDDADATRMLPATYGRAFRMAVTRCVDTNHCSTSGLISPGTTRMLSYC